MGKELWKAVIAVAVEEIVRRFLPPLLPFVLLCILLGVTWEAITYFAKRKFARSFYARLGVRQKMWSWPLVAIFGAGLSLFYWWGIQKVLGASAEPFAVNIEPPFFINTSLNTDYSWFWLRYRSVVSGDTLSPMGICFFVKITNLQDRPSLVDRYSMQIQSEGNDWLPLKHVEIRTGQVYWAYEGLQKASLWDFSTTGLDYLLGDKPIEAKRTVEGWAFFTPSRVYPGADRLRYRFRIHDTVGANFDYVSDYLRIESPVPEGEAEPQLKRFIHTGQYDDLTKLPRKLWNQEPAMPRRGP